MFLALNTLNVSISAKLILWIIKQTFYLYVVFNGFKLSSIALKQH